MRRQPLSLKGRALALLAQRDQSRLELRRKLLRHAAPPSRHRGEGRGEGLDEAAPDPEAVEATVDALLDSLEADGFLSVDRFVESRIHARATRFGNQRIRAELAQHGAALTPEQAERLRASELERAAAVHARRFAAPVAGAADHAARQRFLAARGFSADVIRRVLRPPR